MKKWNWSLTILAIINCACLLAIGNYVNGLHQGMAIMSIFIFPLYILSFSILVAIFSFAKRKVWFVKEIIFSTYLMLFFCSPISLFIGWQLFQPSLKTITESSGFDENKKFKTEEDIVNGKTIAIRHWIRNEGESNYLKDSTWVYFNNDGDTAKLQTYRNDTLLSEKLLIAE